MRRGFFLDLADELGDLLFLVLWRKVRLAHREAFPLILLAPTTGVALLCMGEPETLERLVLQERSRCMDAGPARTFSTRKTNRQTHYDDRSRHDRYDSSGDLITGEGSVGLIIAF